MENKVLNSCITVSGIAILSVVLYLLFNRAVVWMASWIQLPFFIFFIEVVVAVIIAQVLLPIVEILVIVLFINLAISLRTESQVNVKDLMKIFVGIQASEIIYHTLEETLDLKYGMLKGYRKYFCRNFCLFCACRSYVKNNTISTDALVESVGEYYNDSSGIRGKIGSVTFIATVIAITVSILSIYLIMKRRFWHVLYLPPFIMLVPFIFLSVNSIFFILNFNNICVYESTEDCADIRSTLPIVNIFDAVDKGSPAELKKQKESVEVTETVDESQTNEEFIN